MFTKAQLFCSHIRAYVPIAWKDVTDKSLQGFAEPPITLQFGPPGAQAWKKYTYKLVHLIKDLKIILMR